MSNLSTIFLSLLLINCLVGLYALLTKKLEKKFLPLVLAVICSFIDEILAHYFKIKYRNNLAIYYFGGSFEYAFFAWFIFANVNNKIVKKFITYSVIIFLTITFIGGYSFCKEAYADPFSAITHHNYFIIAKGILITIWSILYFKGIFDSITRYEYLNVYTLLAVAGMLFYYAFSTIYFSAETYLINQALKENPNLLTDIYKIKMAAFSYAYNQLKDIKVFLFLTNILLYLCIFVAFLRGFFPIKKDTIGF